MGEAGWSWRIRIIQFSEFCWFLEHCNAVECGSSGQDHNNKECSLLTDLTRNVIAVALPTPTLMQVGCTLTCSGNTHNIINYWHMSINDRKDLLTAWSCRWNSPLYARVTRQSFHQMRYLDGSNGNVKMSYVVRWQGQESAEYL